MIFLEKCYFRDGYMQGGVSKHVTNIDTEDRCALYVKQEYPEAPGATWSSNDEACYAEFGEHLSPSSLHRTCLFHQGYKSYSSLTLNIFGKNMRSNTISYLRFYFILL